MLLWLVACAPSAPGGEAPDDTGRIRGAVAFALPLLETELFPDVTIGVDHDPDHYDGAYQLTCTAFDGRGFPACYDGHRGSDYILDGNWETMDSGSATIVAAADGVVIDVEDGHYDRCHGDLATGENDCDGYEMVANQVWIDHGDGVVSRYLHMMIGVVVSVGDEVQCGDVLGKVGSSGNSSQPHLHFQLEVEAEVVDPYAGDFSQPETWWQEQGDPEGLPAGACP